jgi:hypothetical protein
MQKKRDVEIKVLLEKSSFNEQLNRMNSQTIKYFKKNAIEARFDNKSF